MELVEQTPLTDDERTALEAWLPRLRTLHEVIRWGLGDDPARIITEVVVQDEFTHDVVMPWSAGRYLVFDTT